MGKARNSKKDLGVDGKIVLKPTLKKWDVKDWKGMNWFGIGYND
jgi:hypothetical protein